MEERIKNKIINHINISFLNVINESYLHASHLHGGKETHFKIEIKSDEFEGKTMIQIHKMINNILKGEFENGLHALSIKVLK